MGDATGQVYKRLANLLTEKLDLSTVAGSGLFSLISQVFLTYFFIISRFPTISQLFSINFTVISHFSITSHLFPNYFSFPDDASHFSVTLPNYFSFISRLFPSESPDIFAIYNWLISAPTSRRLSHGVTVKSE